jgi:predicted ArsR family transcriptional regulator
MNENRAKIEAYLMKKSRTISELVAIMKISRQCVSFHLNKMQEAGEAEITGTIPPKGGGQANFIWALTPKDRKPLPRISRKEAHNAGVQKIKRRKATLADVPRATNWGGYLESPRA